MVIVSEAHAIAREWVWANRERIPGYIGAYLAGSVSWLADNDPISPNSDIDIMIVVEDDTIAPKPGKFIYHNVLLEASIVPFSLIADPGPAAGRYHIATSIARQKVLDDPFEMLGPRFAIIAAEFPRRHRVIARMDAVQSGIVTGLGNIPADTPFHQQVMMWLFPTGVTTHLLLVAGLRNPTVRRRYVEARHLLESYGESAQFDALLALIGCEHITRRDADRYLAALEPVFATAATVESSTSRWTSDISSAARRISIDGTQELIGLGYYRESMFWIVATFTRCLDVLAKAGEERISPQADLAFRSLMTDLGIESLDDITTSSSEVIAALPAIRATADRILDRNPEVTQ